MQAPLQKKTEVKVYILYVMKNIGYAVDYTHLNDSITADGPVSYFSFTECFPELIETGNIKAIESDEGEKFVISEQGTNVVDNLLYLLIPSVQRAALACATRFTDFDKRGAVISCGYTENEDMSYRYRFEVKEKGEEVFSISLTLKNKEQVERIESNLQKNPDNIYKSIMALLSGQANYLLE